jgi:DnaJ-class molecular chaperone
MNEIELRQECYNCNGVGGYYSQMTRGPVKCFECKGSGLIDWSKVEILELEEENAKVSQNHL